MAKILLVIALASALLDAVDVYWFSGKYTDAGISMTSEVLRSFGL